MYNLVSSCKLVVFDVEHEVVVSWGSGVAVSWGFGVAVALNF